MVFQADLNLDLKVGENEKILLEALNDFKNEAAVSLAYRRRDG
jgi:hypothetical protein